MANVSDLYPSNYLKASDLKGTQPVVTIDRVEFEPVGRQKEMKPIVYFAGKDKGVVLNKTNANKIAELAGSTETDDWTGVKVRLFSTHVEFQGESVEAIRIKAAPPSGAGSRPVAAAPKPAPAREPGDDDMHIDASDVPFAWLLPFLVPALAAAGVVFA